MKMKKLVALLLALVILSALPSFAAGVGSGAEQLQRLRDLDELLQTYYVYGIDGYPLPDSLEAQLNADPALYDSVAQKMFARLDKYSHYMNREEYDVAYPLGQAYVGVGISMEPMPGAGIYVSGVVETGPAKEAGILPGDLIIAADGVDLTGINWEVASDVLRGEADSAVSLTVARSGESKPLVFKITRKAMSLPNVTYSDLGDGVGYISISRFGSVWDFVDFINYYNDAPYEGIRSMIIDLRNNPGGSVEVTANMLNVFFDKYGQLLFQLDYADETMYYTASGGRMWKPNELIVLVNENSASAAEVFAGVLMGQKAATVVGVNTYGKARGQFHIEIDDGSVAIITSSRITVDNVPDYNEKGITPSKIVPLEVVDYPMPVFSQLDASTGVFRTSSARVKALEERLSALGFFYAEPDATFDLYTQCAIQNFQCSRGMKASKYASAAALKEVEKALAELSKEKVYVDSQFKAAYEIALKGVKNPLTGILPKRELNALPFEYTPALSNAAALYA